MSEVLEGLVALEVLNGYKDLQIGRRMDIGEKFETDAKRAEVLLSTVDKFGQPIVRLRTHIQPTKVYDLTPPLKTPEDLQEDGSEVRQTVQEDKPIEKNTRKMRYSRRSRSQR